MFRRSVTHAIFSMNECVKPASSRYEPFFEITNPCMHASLLDPNVYACVFDLRAVYPDTTRLDSATIPTT